MGAPETYRNFIYQIERISLSPAISRARFKHNDLPLNFDPAQGGMDRLFAVYWSQSDELLDMSDSYSREHNHTFVVEVAYDPSRDLDALHALILDDRHRLIKALRNGDNKLGYSGSATATTGLRNRVFLSDELDRSDESVWFLRQSYRCLIEEIE